MGLFRQPEGYSAILEAAQSARDDGQITMLQYWLIRQRCRRDDVCAEVREAILHEAAASGASIPKSSNGAPDWNAILDFIKQLIPLILQIVGLFT